MCSSLPKGKFVSEIFSFSLKTKETKNTPNLLKIEFKDRGISLRLKNIPLDWSKKVYASLSSARVPGSPGAWQRGMEKSAQSQSTGPHCGFSTQ